MNFRFDHFKQLQNPEFYLCNPDQKQIACITVRNAKLTLRFNSLSSIMFDALPSASNLRGETAEFDYYDKIETPRLIYVTDIGWFQIHEVTEFDDGQEKYKSITAESAQAAFKNFGFYMEARLYKFYNPADPKDERYNEDDPAAIPSVIGQLYQQLGIRILLDSYDKTVTQDYGDWTITYIDRSLCYIQEEERTMCRSFTDSKALFAYDFMVNEASNAFEAVFIFDFLHHAIKIKPVGAITTPTNIYLSFDNLANRIQVTGKADEIVTVLNCNGTSLDIRAVNPIGTNYIVNFDYFMDTPGWMSDELVARLRAWKIAVAAAAYPYSNLVLELRQKYAELAEIQTDIVFFSRALESLKVAVDQHNELYLKNAVTGQELFTAEEVLVDGKSILAGSAFYSIPFTGFAGRRCYKNQPAFSGGKFVFDSSAGNYSDKTFDENYLNGTTLTEPQDSFLYFSDGDDRSYCKLFGGAVVVEKEECSERAEYHVAGFTRFSIYLDIAVWTNIYSVKLNTEEQRLIAKDAEIEAVIAAMAEISGALNLIKQFADDPVLFKELKAYWIEGSFENKTLAVFDTTTPAEAIDLAGELLESGRAELVKVSQPRFSLTVDAVNFTKLSEFQSFTSDLELGKIITIEKSDGVHFYPALTQMSFDLNDGESFELTFSNAFKLSDWGYTFADLITSASNTARTVSAHWQELIGYSNDKDDIRSMLLSPLDRILRIAKGNLVNQQFVIDDTGILGRMLVRGLEDYGTFEDEQVRIINNLILFTKDGWRTVETALGKIQYDDPETGAPKTAYGLVSDAIIGRLLLGETLWIKNKANSVSINENGIRILNPDDLGDARFIADPNGNVYIKGTIEASGGMIAGWKIEENYLTNDIVGISSDKGSGAYSFWAGAVSGAAAPFSVTPEGALVALRGLIGGLELSDEGLRAANFEIKVTGEYGSTRLAMLKFNTQNSSDTPTEISDTAIQTSYISARYGISADSIVAASYLGAGILGIQNGKISGTDTFIQFDHGTNATVYTARLSWRNNFPWIQDIIITLNEPLQSALYFNVSYTGIGCFGTSSVGIWVNPSDGTKKTTTINKFFLGIDSAWFASTGSASNTFRQGGGSTNIDVKGNMLPSADATYDLGSTTIRWDSVWAERLYSASGTVTDSDKKKKKTIQPIGRKYSALFDKLRPVTFKYKNGSSGRKHIGLIAGEVKEAIESSGLSTQDCAAYCSWQDGKGKESSGIRYDELVSLLIYEIQQLKKRVNDLEGKMNGV